MADVAARDASSSASAKVGRMTKQKSFILPHGQQALLDCLAELPTTERYEVVVKKYQKRRSVQANSYWWAAIVTPLAEHCGYTPEEMHRELCGSYFGWETKEFRGRKFMVPRRTTTTPTTLGTMEFSDLIHHGHSVAAELGVSVEQWNQAA